MRKGDGMNKRHTTKQRLLHILKKDKECSMTRVMSFFDISEIAVRKHLHELEQQGFVRKNTIKQKMGRPYYTYELTKKGHGTFPNQYEKLPLELLQDLEEVQGHEAVNAVFKKRMEREKAYFNSKLESIESFDQKISEIAKIQDEKGYMVEVQKTEEGYEIINFNCPIANIASAYGQVCNNEKEVFNDLFPASEVKAHSYITNGHNYCKWTIKKPGEGE
ncbi:hypothetical protein X953_13440 [Virgibacillus sp. SK37]|nr:hypothetical protein X953_13440 [Virgibacillus sp. SK37]